MLGSSRLHFINSSNELSSAFCWGTTESSCDLRPGPGGPERTCWSRGPAGPEDLLALDSFCLIILGMCLNSVCVCV